MDWKFLMIGVALGAALGFFRRGGTITKGA